MKITGKDCCERREESERKVKKKKDVLMRKREGIDDERCSVRGLQSILFVWSQSINSLVIFRNYILETISVVATHIIYVIIIIIIINLCLYRNQKFI